MKYDPEKVKVNINGVPILGFAEGTFVEVETNGGDDKWSHYVGADGDVTTEKNVDPTGTLTVTLKHDSPSAITLENLAKQGARVSGLVKDLNLDPGVKGAKGTGGYVEPSTQQRGEEVSEIEYVIKFEKLEPLPT